MPVRSRITITCHFLQAAPKLHAPNAVTRPEGHSMSDKPLHGNCDFSREEPSHIGDESSSQLVHEWSATAHSQLQWRMTSNTCSWMRTVHQSHFHIIDFVHTQHGQCASQANRSSFSSRSASRACTFGATQLGVSPSNAACSATSAFRASFLAFAISFFACRSWTFGRGVVGGFRASYGTFMSEISPAPASLENNLPSFASCLGSSLSLPDAHARWRLWHRHHVRICRLPWFLFRG